MNTSASLFDPSGAPVLLSALDWITGALLGTLATAIGVIAVALVGFLMMQGRVPVKRGISVVVGLFILLGAPAIAGGLVRAGNGVWGTQEAAPLPVQVPQQLPPAPKPTAYDPYAGASVPVQK
jgi:type IV secretory pathway VirB2 component (pilin)